MHHLENLQQTDPAVYDILVREEHRQFEKIRLIPSENYVSSAVL